MAEDPFKKTTSIKTAAGKRLEKLKKHDVLELSYNSKSYPIVGEITIGRDEINTIVLDDSMASRCHALIQKIKDEYFLKDLNSTNNTYVNESAIPKDKYIRLLKDDVVRIGRTELTIR